MRYILFFLCFILHFAPSMGVGPLEHTQIISKEKPHLLLYYTPWCPYSQRVLEYLRQIQKTVPMKNIQNDAKGREELKKVGGKSQVPCLFIDGKPLYDSTAIIQWLSTHKDLLLPA